MNIVGIDPGKDGGVVSLSDAGLIRGYFIPVKIGTVLDIQAYCSYLNSIIRSSTEDTHIFIEDVHSVFGASAKANFQFGRICGLIEGMVVSLQKPYTMVQPKEWQKEMFQGVPVIKKPGSKAKGRGSFDTKKMAEVAFRRLFPETDFNVTSKGNKSKNVHDGLVDAILIAEYGRRKLTIRRS